VIRALVLALERDAENMQVAKTIMNKMLQRGGPNKPVRAARVWSNDFIKQVAPHVSGRVVNVSAWKDEDKEGRAYRTYFTNASSYETTNFDGWRGAGIPSNYSLDLQRPAPAELRGAFDLVFNHTTLEHIYDFRQAFATLAELSRDAMLLVVPWIQPLHGPVDGDFWRFSPYAIRRLFAEHGFTIIAEQAGPVGGAVRYLTHFAARSAEAWEGRLPVLSNDVVGVSAAAV
jgi:hypothetical protein